MAKEQPAQAEVNIGMVGHVDHGKTTVVAALTGKRTDTHSEEMKKGISIRLGYANAVFYKCGKCGKYSPVPKCSECGTAGKVSRKVSFVDAPGHETLMATMLSGATLMNGAVLVIAANEPCPQPRTEEHLMALKMSGIKEVVVVQNKVDLVDKQKALENHKQIKNLLKEYGYDNPPIIPTAANFGINIDALVEAIEGTIRSPKFDSAKKPKMFVARSFDINRPGIKPRELRGSVLGGSLIQGELKKGDEIVITPGLNGKKLLTKIIGLRVEEGSLEKARPGGLISIETDLDPSLGKSDEMKGQMVSFAGVLPEPVTTIKLSVEQIKRLITRTVPEIKVNDFVVLTVGTMTVIGTVVKQSKKNEYEFALREPVVIEKNQRVAISKRDGNSWRLAAYGTFN
ncbi:MAG: translation initiation factor IF-2 subunit gamma [Candidatus Diapherotrites archaeon]|nr:translation initiation factor IF-2 subunit gamma [Candidatus Diapherotrites archaeon]